MQKFYFKTYSNKAVLANSNLRMYFSGSILEEAYTMVFADKELIQKADHEMQFLYFIVDGNAKIYDVQPNGKRTILQFLTSSDFIGDLTIVGAEKTTKDVVSIGETISVAIPMTTVKNELINDNRFLQRISKYIGEKLLIRMDHFSKNQTYELKYRLAEVLIQVSVNGSYTEKHSQISEYLGVSYRHLLYTLKAFQEQGYIEKTNSGYKIDQNRLEELLSDVQR